MDATEREGCSFQELDLGTQTAQRVPSQRWITLALFTITVSANILQGALGFTEHFRVSDVSFAPYKQPYRGVWLRGPSGPVECGWRVLWEPLQKAPSKADLPNEKEL